MISLLLAALLPARIDPPQPFPRITADAPSVTTIAPGIESGEYALVTSEGPIVVRVIAIAPHRADVRVDSVLADNALTGHGETISSMAHRTEAVAGINADYFDIGNTNAPTNIVVRGGELVRTPRKRYALVALDDGTAQIVENTFLGQVQLADRTVSLDAVNEFPPPDGGVSLLTPAFGSVPALDNLTLVALTPNAGAPPFTQYTVGGTQDNTTRQPAGYYLAIGVNAYGKTGVPNAGDRIDITGDLSPVPLAHIAGAVGGGPLLLENGAPADDPDGPNGGEYAQRIPASGAALRADGTLLLLEVDGRQPFESVGVTRPEFAALMRAFGAERGMAFDGGGSSTLVERRLGATVPNVVNVPSDGIERPVADGIFVYSTAPVGPPSQLIAQPQVVRALPGARLPVDIETADDAEHVLPKLAPVDVKVDPPTLGTLQDGTFIAREAGTGAIVAQSGALVTRIPVEVAGEPARLTIVPPHPNVARDGSITLRARAFDADGYALALPETLPWRATGAAIDGSGALTAGGENAIVSLLIGDRLADVTVTVGSHDVALAPAQARFMTVPRGGDGSVEPGTPCEDCFALRYHLGPQERAGYAILETPLPADSIAIAFDLLDDGNGANLRLALRNAINEEVLLPATRLDHPGWRRVVVHLSQSLAQPARLTGIYVIGANASATASGTIEIKDLTASVAGQR